MADGSPWVLGVAVRDPSWFQPLDRRIYLAAGAPAPKLLRIPIGDAQLILSQTIREVAGLAAFDDPDVVLTSGRSELLVHTRAVGLSAAAGLIIVGLPVSCDQVQSGESVQVKFGVGTEEAPAGLVMTTFDRPSGPEVIVDGWGGELTAFAWAAIVHMAQSLCAAAGSDAAGSPLVPGYLSAMRDLIILQPMAAHAKFGRQS